MILRKLLKIPNLRKAVFSEKIQREDFIKWMDLHQNSLEHIYHLGARTDTTSNDKELFNRLNLQYSKDVFDRCSQYQIPLVYASSAATYGDGSLGL